MAFTRTYTLNIPDIVMNDLGRLFAVNILASGYTATTPLSPYTFRVLGLQYDRRNSFYRDYGNPILSMAQQTNMCSYNSVELEYKKEYTRKKSTGFNRFQRIYRLFRGVGEKADFQYFSIFYGKLCFWLYPYTLASTLQIIYIFYIIFLLDLKRCIRNMIYMGGIY